jgi:hypothetical protein
MSMNKQGQVFLVYTWNRKRIKSITWEPNNLVAYLHQVHQEIVSVIDTPTEMKEAK